MKLISVKNFHALDFTKTNSICQKLSTTSQEAMYKTTFAILLLACFFLGVPGCGKARVPRHNLSGKVTFKGKPVPVGLIVFEPDASKGNRGPQGYAQIFDGCYETEKFGKGAMTGALRVEITGFPAADGSEENPNTPLFPPYKTNVYLTDNTTTLDFVVPIRPK
ncbi:MAG: hypothetical protein JW818_05520 [Pirellulales bacterium]|nr:hypothetical protein [Pirellulales bacterium]